MAVQKYHVALLGASIAVLLITCANLTGLMAVRVVAEERDTAVRLALGASRSSIALRLIGEAAIIAVAGAALGSLIAVWLAAIGRSLAPMVTTSIVPVTTRVSAPVILICCVAATVSLVATSAVPALRASRGSPLMVLNESFGMTGRQPRVMKVVVAGQIGFATTLMIAAVLMIRAANAIANTEFGYDARRLWSVQLGLVPSRSGDTTGLGSAEQSLFGSFIRNAHLIPGILGVSRIDQELSEGGRISAESRVSTLGLPSYWNTSSDILTTMGVRVILGRGFVPADSFSGAAIVDIDVARKLWGAEPAIGKTLILGINSPTTRRVTVVGVIPRIMMSFDRDPDMQEAQTVFVVVGVSAPPGFMRQFVVRTVTEDPRYAAALAQVSAAGNAIVGPWTDSYRSFADSRQAIALMFVMFSVCGLLLSGSGLYAVLANDLALRKRELAVRVALGAQSDSIAFLLVREVSPMLFGGAAFGVYLAFASTKLLGAWLYSVSPYDATAFAVSVAAVSALVALATALPARSAMKADPSMILRAS